MSIRFEVVGTGLTKRSQPIIEIESLALEPASDGRAARFILTTKEPSDPEERRAIQRVMEDAASASTFDGLVEPWEAWARELLARVGIPSFG